jgi:hypothetical protein
VNSFRTHDKKEFFINKFEDCFINGCVKSQCGRNIIEFQVVLKNISDTMKSIDEKDISYHTLRSILDLTLKGIAEIPGNCADDSDHYKPEEPEYELAYCPFCLQMTNHLNNICQKHKDESEEGSEELRKERIWVLEEIEKCLPKNQMINPQDGIRIINRISKKNENNK